MLGAGFVGLVAATFWAFPELRRGWWAVAVLVNPALVEALLLGQLPFLWAAAMLMAAIGCWRRDRRKLAVRPRRDWRSSRTPPCSSRSPRSSSLLRYRSEPNRRALVVGWLISLS